MSLSGFHLTHSGSGGPWPCYLADPACEELCPQPQRNHLRFGFVPYENSAVTRPTSQTVMKDK